MHYSCSVRSLIGELYLLYALKRQRTTFGHRLGNGGSLAELFSKLQTSNKIIVIRKGFFFF